MPFDLPGPAPTLSAAMSYPIKNLSSLSPKELVPYYTDKGFTESVIKALVDGMVSGDLIATGVSDNDLVRKYHKISRVCSAS